LQHRNWRKKRQYAYYKPPPTVGPDGSFALGAKESWLEGMDYLNSDLTWLLNLEHFRYMLIIKVQNGFCAAWRTSLQMKLSLTCVTVM
jgi:hypothetical protein